MRRYAEAFEQLGLTFNKMRPAKRFLRRIADSPEEVLTPDARARFEKLFEIIGDRLTKLMERDRPPFQ